MPEAGLAWAAKDDDAHPGIRCHRCDRVSLITIGELRGEAGSPAGMVLLPVPTDGSRSRSFDADERSYEFDPNGLICNDCAVRHYPGALDQYKAELGGVDDAKQVVQVLEEAATSVGDDLPDEWREDRGPSD